MAISRTAKVAAVVMLAGCLLLTPGSRSLASILRSDSIDIAYGTPNSQNLERIYHLIRNAQLLEKLRKLLRPLRLPHRILLQTRNCEGIANAWSNDESVTVCYEFLDEILKSAPEKTTPGGVTPIDGLIGPTIDVLLHETGHAVFHALHIPIFGREEDAADQFSTYLMLRFPKEEARRLVIGSAYQYRGDLLSPTVTIKQRQFSDEHGTSAQRFYNLLCMAYGADSQLFADVVAAGFLPTERAEGCKNEFEQVSFAFDRLIRPYIDKKLARRLHENWLLPAGTSP